MASEPPALASNYKDCGGRLVAVGVLEILIGAFCLLLMAASAVASLFAPAGAAHASVTSVVGTIGTAAAIFLTLGIGSVNKLRWARAIGLCLGWMGLVVGVLSTISMAMSVPHLETTLKAQMAATNSNLPDGAVKGLAVMSVVMVGVIYLGISGTMILCYRGENVRRTCEARDASPRWTDRLPLPVLAMLLVEASTAVALLATIPTYGRATLLFGALITGWPSVLIYVLFTAVSAYTAYLFYRLDVRAYWISLALVVLFGVNSWISFSGDGLMRIYRALDLPAAQLRLLEQSPLVTSGGMRWYGPVGAVVFIVVLGWVKRYLAPRPPAA